MRIPAIATADSGNVTGNSGEDVAPQLHAMLSTWLIHHIKRDDVAYVQVVNASITRIVENKKEGNWLSRSLDRFFK